MDSNYIEIILYGYSFYIPANRVRDLAYIDNKLVNISDSSITMVENFNSYTSTNYPRITCASMSPCVIRTSNNYSQIVEERYVNASDKININIFQQEGMMSIIIILLAIIVALKLLFKK